MSENATCNNKNPSFFERPGRTHDINLVVRLHAFDNQINKPTTDNFTRALRTVARIINQYPCTARALSVPTQLPTLSLRLWYYGAATASRLAASGGRAGFAHCPGAPPPSAATSARTTESQSGWCEPRTVRRAAARGVPAGVRAWLGLTWLGLGLGLELGSGSGLESGQG